MPRTTDDLLPKNWARHAKSAVLYIISLAQVAVVAAQAKVAKRATALGRLQLEHDRLRQEVTLLREELCVKDARMSRLAPQKRPHYLPTERLTILELRAARGWNVEQTAQAFHVTSLTIGEWMGRLESEGAESFIAMLSPMNKFPEFVHYLVQRLKLLCPWLGRQKIAETLARAGLHLAASTVRRFLFAPTKRPAAAKTADEKPLRTTAPNEVWNCDLTAVPKLGGFWIPWLPQAIAQHWPWCFWVAAVTDHFSRRVMGTKVFDDAPSSTEVRRFLAEVMRQSKIKPAVLITDQGPQFTPEGFQAWCERRHVEPRFGAVGKHGSIAVIERFFGTLKREFLRRQVVPLRRADLQREVGSFIIWFNGFRPHSGLGGCTPNEVYFRRSPANQRPRIEPRARWPRASPCAMPLASIKGPCGQRVELHVRYHAGDKRLPVVTLRRVA